MRKSILLAIVLAFVLTAAVTPAFGQYPCCQRAFQAAPGKGPPNYDPATEVTLKGTLEAVDRHESPGGWQGVHLRLKTDGGVIDVHVGPSWFVQEKGFAFAPGDALEVLGSRVALEGTDSLLAREIRRGGKTLVLRDARGIPAWSGGRRRAPTS
jgi:hypothetical protein